MESDVSFSSGLKGFTLIQLSAIVLVLGLISAAMLPTAGNVTQRTDLTGKHVAQIQKAMRGYMATNGTLPCPAVPFRRFSEANYGVAASSGTACDTTDLLNNWNAGTSTGAFIGMVPVKTLGLPDDVALDGFGRRLTYAVDGKAASAVGCATLQSASGRGGLDIRTTAAGATQKNAMWLLLSHGKDGHGAFPAAPAAGATLASRINIGAGMTDAETLTNANVDAAFADSIDAIFSNKSFAANFDDSLWLDSNMANTCGLGQAWKDGYYLTMQTDADFAADSSPTAVGDINGDGYDDIVVGAAGADYNSRSNSGSVYISFGGPSPFVSATALASSGTSPTRIRIDGAAASDAIGAAVAVGDVNGDGRGDVIISSTAREWVYVLFGRTNWASSTDISSLTGGTMTTGFRFGGSTAENEDIGTSLAVADVNRDGYGDIIAGAPGSDTGASNAGAVYVIFGRKTVWGAGGFAYLGEDTATQGNWQGVYGSQGYLISQHTTLSPSFANVSFSAEKCDYLYTASTSDVRALRRTDNSSRIAGIWFAAGACVTNFVGSHYDITVDITDGSTRKVSIYMLDYDGWAGGGGRNSTIEVRDSNSDALLDTRNVTGYYASPKYLSWRVSSDVYFRIINNSASNNATSAGLFFDPNPGGGGGATISIATELIANADYVKHTHVNGSGPFGTVVAAGDVNGDGFADVVASVQTTSASSNVALASAGATATALTEFSSDYVAGKAIDGFTFGSYVIVRAWAAATTAKPDWLEVNFNTTRTISTIDVFSVQDDIHNPPEPTLSTTFTLYGLKEFKLQYWSGGTWVDIPGTSVSGNNLVWKQFVLGTPVTTSKIRVYSTDVTDYSRIMEVRAWDTTATGYGEVYTIFGKASPSSVSVSSAISSANGFRLLGKNGYGSGVGDVLAVGDINGDRKDDIVIGAPNSTISSVANAGIVHVVYGQAFGSASYDLDTAGILNGTTGFYINGTVANQYIGKGLAFAKVNNDAYEDLAISGGIDGSNNLDTRVVLGKSTAFASTNAIGTLINGTAKTNGFILRRTSAGLTSNHLTSADVNGDKRGDLVIPFTNATRRTYVVMGRDIDYFQATTAIDGF